MMKRQLMATVSLLAFTGIASAADLPARMPVKAAPPPAIIQLWAGPYVGINGGAVWHRLDTDTVTNIGTPYDSVRLRATGGTFGGQIGYNWQSQNFVFGLEADLNWVSAKKTEQHFAANGLGFSVIHATKLEWLGTVRGRAGVTLGTHTLVYATGGLAIAGVDNSWQFAPPIVCAGSCVASNNETRLGWTVGGGIERFISNPHVTVKAEALYVDLGRDTLNGAIQGNYTSRFRNTEVIGRLGLNLKW